MHLKTTASDCFTITDIGTCRLDGPLRAGAQKRGYQRVSSRIYGYAHSIPEVVQQVRYLHGDYRPDPALWHIIAQRDFQKVNSEIFKPADFYLVEISSRKQLSIDGHSVQINHLKAACAPFFDGNKHKSRFWRALRDRDEQTQLSMIDAFDRVATLSADQKHVLRRLRLTETTDEELAVGLSFVRDVLGAVVVVTHVNANRRDGGLIPSRDICVSQIERVAKDAGLAVFNPTDLMHEVGQHRAIEDESESYAHFTSEFSELLFDAWQAEHLDHMINHRLEGSAQRCDLLKYENHMRACMAAEGIERVNARVDRLKPALHLASEFVQTRMRLKFNANLVAQGQSLAAMAVKQGILDRSLFFHATQHAYLAKDARRLRDCIRRACRDGLVDQNPWLMQALCWLAELDPRGAVETYSDLLLKHPNRASEYAKRYRDLVIAHPGYVSKESVTALLSTLCAASIDPKLAAEVAVAVRGNPLVILCNMIGQSSKRFMVAFCVFAKADLVLARTAAYAVLMAVAHLARKNDTLFEAKLAQWKRETDPSQQRLFLRDMLRLQPDNPAVVRLMTDVTHSCVKAAKQAYQQRDLEELVFILDQAEQHLPRVDDVPYFISRIQYERKQFNAAFDMAKTAVAWAPDRARNWTILLRPAVKLRLHDAAEEAASAVLRLAGPGDEKLALEAKERLNWAHERLWARALLGQNAPDTLMILKRVKSATQLAENLQRDLPVVVDALCIDFERHLRRGEVYEAWTILRGIAPVYAAFPDCRGIILAVAQRTSSLALLSPVLQHLATPTGKVCADDGALRRLIADITNHLEKNEVMVLT